MKDLEQLRDMLANVKDQTDVYDSFILKLFESDGHTLTVSERLTYYQLQQTTILLATLVAMQTMEN